MALAPFETLDEFLESDEGAEHSSRTFIRRPPLVGPQGPAGPVGPPGPPGGIIGSYSVKSYGAIGNTLADDTNAFNLAIAAAHAAGGGTVYAPPGKYKITSTLTLPPGVKLQGAGRMNSVLLAGVNGLIMISYVATALSTDFDIQDLGFWQQGFSNVIAISLDGVNSVLRISIVHLRNLYFNTRTGVILRFCANVTIENCFANSCVDGFWLINTGDVTMVGCMAQNGSGYGFLIQGGPGAVDEGIKLISCSTNGQAYGLSVNGQDWGMAVGCSFTTCSGGPIILSATKAWRISATDIAAADDGVAGLVMDDECSDIQVTACYVALNSFGIVLAGERNSVTNCNFQSNASVDVISTATKCVVSANIMASIGYPSSIAENSPADYNVYTGNITAGAISLLGTHSAEFANVPY